MHTNQCFLYSYIYIKYILCIPIHTSVHILTSFRILPNRYSSINNNKLKTLFYSKFRTEVKSDTGKYFYPCCLTTENRASVWRLMRINLRYGGWCTAHSFYSQQYKQKLPSYCKEARLGGGGGDSGFVGHMKHRWFQHNLCWLQATIFANRTLGAGFSGCISWGPCNKIHNLVTMSFINKLVDFGRACAPVRSAHPYFWAHCHTKQGAARPPRPITASLLLIHSPKL
jgi:hypothetical protein